MQHSLLRGRQTSPGHGEVAAHAPQIGDPFGRVCQIAGPTQLCSCAVDAVRKGDGVITERLVNGAALEDSVVHLFKPVSAPGRLPPVSDGGLTCGSTTGKTMYMCVFFEVLEQETQT